MKSDEFAFFNQQLAAMLRDGIPLEGALKRLCADMRRGALRLELEKLEAALAKGVSIKDALADRKLPDFYTRMVQVGVQSNDLPGVLLLLADYYERANLIGTRLKGLMVYPMIVLTAAFVLSCGLSVVTGWTLFPAFQEIFDGFTFPIRLVVNLCAPPVLVGTAFVSFLIVITVPQARRALRWHLPAFKEASLAQVASAMWLMLKSGTHLNDALGLMQQLEKGTRAGRELAEWQARLARGHGKFSELARPGKTFPPLFVWLVANAGEDLAEGFRRAADIYQARANHRSELMLFAALPFSVLGLGAVIACQGYAVASFFLRLMAGTM